MWRTSQATGRVSDPEHALRHTPRWSRLFAGRLGALARSLAVAMLLAATLIVGLSLAHTSSVAPVCACGLGNTVTMVANNAPALAYAPPNDATDAPAGIFALDYFANKPVTFYEDLSRLPNAPDLSTIKWQWDFGDGSPFSYEYKPTHTFTTPGSFTVKVFVYEPVSGQWGLFDNAIMHIIATPFANPPVAQAHALTSAVIGVGGQITFDATGSHAVVGSALTYSWNFGDNSVAEGTKVTHLFKQAGRGFVTLTVTDARGARSIAQVSVVIIETAQQAFVSASVSSAQVGAQISFDASRTTPPVDQPVEVSWDFGDGSPLVTTSTPTIAHAYKAPGAYTVTVGVYGQLGDGGVTTVKVKALGVAGASSPGSSSQRSPNWLLIGGGALLVILALSIGLVVWLNQRKRAAALRQRQLAAELARARRVNGGQPRPRLPADGRTPRQAPGVRASRQDAPTSAPGYRGAPSQREREQYPPDREMRRR